MAGYERQPCPGRILDDLGSGFGIGLVGGGLWNFSKGAYNSPWGQRLRGGATTARMNAPRVGGGFAAWGGLFSACDCTLVYLRQKEDPWNSILSGSIVSGFFAIRQGFGPMARAAVLGGCMLGLIEGVMIMSNSAQQFPQMMIDDRAPPAHGGAGGGEATSWFNGLFRGGKEEVISTVKTEVLESFDSPVPPTFDF